MPKSSLAHSPQKKSDMHWYIQQHCFLNLHDGKRKATSMPKHETNKVYGGIDVKLHIFQASALGRTSFTLLTQYTPEPLVITEQNNE
jgi:hypothetical protein